MKRELILPIFIVIFSIITAYAVNNFIEGNERKNTFRTYEISGHIAELKLVTTFPNEGLYVGFDNGKFRFININYWWSYATLSIIQPQNNVTITYERNYYSDIRVLHIEEIPYE